MCSRAALAPANEALADGHEGEPAVAAKRKEPESVASPDGAAGRQKAEGREGATAEESSNQAAEKEEEEEQEVD